MAAVVTDQFRISNASNFVDSVANTSNSYYVFLGLPNPSNPVSGFGRTTSDSEWNSNTPTPTDNLQFTSHILEILHYLVKKLPHQMLEDL